MCVVNGSGIECTVLIVEMHFIETNLGHRKLIADLVEFYIRDNRHSDSLAFRWISLQLSRIPANNLYSCFIKDFIGFEREPGSTVSVV